MNTVTTKPNNNKRYVSWPAITVLVSISVAAFLGLFTMVNAIRDLSQDNRVEIRGVQVSIENIDENILEIKKILENSMQ